MPSIKSPQSGSQQLWQKSIYNYYTTTIKQPLFQDNLVKPVRERLNQSGFKWGKRWWGFGMQCHQLDHIIIIIIIIIAMTMFMVLSSRPKVIARVHPVHLMNVDWAPGGRQPSDQASRLWLWVCRKLAAIIHIRHRHCYYYSARRLILILQSHEGWKAEST